MPFDHERLDERHSGAKALLERIASMLIKLAKSLQGEPPLQDCMKSARLPRHSSGSFFGRRASQRMSLAGSSFCPTVRQFSPVRRAVSERFWSVSTCTRVT